MNEPSLNELEAELNSPSLYRHLPIPKEKAADNAQLYSRKLQDEVKNIKKDMVE